VQIAPDDQIVPRNRFDPGATSQVDLLAVMLAFFRSFPVGIIVAHVSHCSCIDVHVLSRFKIVAIAVVCHSPSTIVSEMVESFML
jgi:hypothetical protein